MNDFPLHMMLTVVSLLFGCTPQTQELGLTDSLDIIKQVKANPSKADSLCSTLSTDELRNQCWSSTPNPKTKEKQIDRCNKLTDQIKDECFFTLAEQHNDVELCSFAGGFSWDCKTHILQQNCGRYMSATSLLRYTEQIGLDPEHQGVAGLLHRCLLSKPQVNIRVCSNLPETERCRRLATNLFSQKIQGTIHCTTQSSSMKTFNDDELEAILKDEMSRQCSNDMPQ